MHEYVWRVKWDQGETGDLGDRTQILLIMNRVWRQDYLYDWRAYKLPHCAIDPDVAFWYDYLSPVWMHRGGILSLGNVWQETSLGIGLLEKIAFRVEIRLSTFC